jgi:formiminotetrahydrofolate cyclodeaminase
MKQPIRKSTLERLCARISRGPTPAGVSVAAISASLALGLLAMTLEVTAARLGDAARDRRRVARLLRSARAASEAMLALADADAAAFDAYLESRRLPRRTRCERTKRERALASSLREATKVPLKVARTALLGLGLCAEAADLVHAGVAPDLDAALLTLGASARIALGSARANIARLKRDGSYYLKALAEAEQIERRMLDFGDRAHAGASATAQRRES